ncbi:MAG: anti-sigma factor [Anaerolineaceae bacterium]
MTTHITQEQADEYAIGALDPDLVRMVALHLGECPACRETVRHAERAAAVFALAAPQRRAPKRLRRKVMRSAGLERTGPLRRAVIIAQAAAGIAAVFVAIAAFTGMVSVRSQVSDLRDTNDHLQTQIDDALSQKVEIAALTRGLDEAERNSVQLKRAAQEDRNLLLALMSPKSDVADVFTKDESAASIGRLVWDEDQKRVWFVASDLAQRPKGETYQLWANSGGKFYSLGVFAPDATGFARYETTVPQGLKSYESAVVTIERAGGSNERSGPSVFVADLSGLRR